MQGKKFERGGEILVLILHLNCGNCFVADPYLNTDAGTMSPFEHGEVFVLDDGGEVFFFFFFGLEDLIIA